MPLNRVRVDWHIKCVGPVRQPCITFVGEVERGADPPDSLSLAFSPAPLCTAIDLITRPESRLSGDSSAQSQS